MEGNHLPGKELNYYGGGNTAKGFVHFFESNFQELDRLFILKGGPGTGKSTLMKSIGEEWRDKGYDVEWIHCSADVGSIDAVLIPSLKIGIVDGTAPHIIEPSLPGVFEEYVDLGIAWDRNKLLPYKEEIIQINQDLKEIYKNAYDSFHKGLLIHDELEKIYINEMNFEKANLVTEEWIERLIGVNSLPKNSIVKHRFLGATTPDGTVNFVENITQDIPKRYFIKGRAGTGKSTMMKKIAAAAESKGFNTEIYHCGFDPLSLDMIVVKELDFVIFDSTAPHEYFPSREGDSIIDLYELVVTPGTDEKYKDEINEVTKKYKFEVQKGIEFLSQTKEKRKQLEQIYIQAMDFSIVDESRERINEIMKKTK